MKKRTPLILVFLMTLNIIVLVTGCTAGQTEPEILIENYFNTYYTQSPLQDDDFIVKEYEGTDDGIKDYFEDITEFINDKYGDVFTTDYIRHYLVRKAVNDEIALVAKYQNANISINSTELKEVESVVDDLFYNFTIEVNVDYIEDKEDKIFQIKGQIKLTRENENEEYKIHSIRHFSHELAEDITAGRFIKDVESQIAIRKNMEYEIKQVDFDGLSTEGACLTGYYDGENLRYLSVWIYGEMVKTNKEYSILKEKGDNLRAYIKITKLDYLEPFNTEGAKETTDYLYIGEETAFKANEDKSDTENFDFLDEQEELKEYISALDSTFEY